MQNLGIRHVKWKT